MASTSSKNVDVLDEDVFTVPGQNFALVSFVGPSQRQKNDKFGMKIRGVFNTKDEADAHVRKIRKFDTITDVYMVDLYKWLLLPPPSNPLDLEDAEIKYQENQKYLEDLVVGHRKNQEQAKMFFEERKAAVMKEGLDKHLLPEERLPPPPADLAVDPAAALAVDDPWVQRKAEKAVEVVSREEIPEDQLEKPKP
jgi:hypothetical protein